MFLKMNSLTDAEMIRKLYEASQAGVKIRMIIRGICSLIPGVTGLSQNIEVVSIVDKYLEHARVFVFANDGDPRYYISSFDWMPRNIDFRSEVGVPIYDKGIQKQLLDMLEIQWQDNVKARVINVQQDNQYRHTRSRTKIRTQEAIYNYLSKFTGL
jgi:polyphosphate kinase